MNEWMERKKTEWKQKQIELNSDMKSRENVFHTVLILI